VAALALAVSAASCTSTAGCPSGQTSCGGACVDLNTDTNNCGECGVCCVVGASCVATGTPPKGLCSCPIPTTMCGIHCVNTQSDAANCGACGRSCGLGTCATGLCTCNASPTTVTMCPLPADPATGTCVNLAADPSNCGACSAVCIPGQTCTALTAPPPPGECECAAPRQLCATDPLHPVCTDLQIDEKNCGSCGRACAVGQSCVAGACGGSCAPGYVLCNGVCVDLQTDASNCGRCGNQCLLGQGCTAGACTTCDVQCGGTCCIGGTGCCGTSCQSQHKDFAGTADEVSYFNCTAPYVYNVDTAEIAAEMWAPTGNTIYRNRACPDGVGPSTCLVRQTGLGLNVACGVFCYAGPLEGAALLTRGSYACPCPVQQRIDWY
jgi:hypothetical protein